MRLVACVQELAESYPLDQINTVILPTVIAEFNKVHERFYPSLCL
jgi:hypothetical protein